MNRTLADGSILVSAIAHSLLLPSSQFRDEGGEEFLPSGAGGGELLLQRVNQGHQLLHFGHDPALIGGGVELGLQIRVRQ